MRRTVIVLMALIAPTTLHAKEQPIRCDLDHSKVTTANPALDARVNANQQQPSTRHYIVDDTARQLYFADTKTPTCRNKPDCSLKFTTNTITMTAPEPNGVTETSIDRQTGRIYEVFRMMNASQQTVMTMEFSGTCKPESLESRKF